MAAGRWQRTRIGIVLTGGASLILSIMVAQAIVSVPAPAQRVIDPPLDTSRLSLVVADTVSETDPQPLCAQQCNSLFLGRYANAIVLAGAAVASEFSARVEMGSPWNMPYRLALIVEQREGQEPLVRAMAGFGDRTREACFDLSDTRRLNWPVSGPGIIRYREVLCVKP